jgi:cytochrome P450
VEQLRPSIQRLVDDLLDGVVGQSEADLIAALAYPLPVAVICELLGVPGGERAAFTQWADILVRELDAGRRPPVEELARAARACSEYFLTLAAERRRNPRSDLLSALATLDDQGSTLSEAELVGTCVLLLTAGYETTVNLIGNGTLALLRHPGQLAYLRQHPQQAPAAIEELMRYDPPVQLVTRDALDDIELGGHQIARGDRLIALIGAANRDPGAFSDPDRLDLTRPENPHLAFGAGIHFCLGAPLARMEGQIAITTLLRRVPALTLAAAGPSYRDNFVLRGPKTLPVRLA